MNNYSRDVRSRIYKACVLMTAFSLVVLLFLSGLSGGVVFAAGNASAVKDGTLLSSGDGLVLGVNNIRTTNDGGLYSSADSSADSRYGHDFYFDPVSVSDFATTAWDGTTNKVGYDTDGFYLNYFTGATDDESWAAAPNFSFKSKIKLTSGNTLSAALGQSLNQVKATVSFSYVAYNASAAVGSENNVDYTDYFDFDLSWSPDGTVDNMSTFSRDSIEVKSTLNTFSTTIALTKTGFSADDAYLDITFSGFSTFDADMETVGTDVKPSTGIFVKFSDVKVSLETDNSYTLGFGAQGLKAEETGSVSVRDDRGVVYTLDEKSAFDFAKDEIGSGFSTSDGAVYLKYSDKLYFYSDVFYTDAAGKKLSFNISDDYSKSLNSDERPITWVLADGQSGLYDWYSTLLVDENPTGSKNQRDGRTSVYKVKYDGEEEKTLVLIPRILYSYSADPDTGEIVHSYVTGTEETVYLDNSIPSTPAIDPESALGTYGYDESVYGIISEQNALRRYSSSLQLQFKLSNIEDIYTTTGTARAPETVYYTVDEDQSPTDASSNRKQAVFSKDGSATITFDKKGFYTIRMATVDAAGNYSDVVTYRVVVDNTDYQVRTAFYGGLSSSATSQTLSDVAMDKIARVYMTTSTAESDKVTKKKTGSYKRGTYVTIKIEMTSKQYADYKLVAAYNGGKGSSYLSFLDESSTPVWDGEKSVYVYEISLLVDKYVDPDLITSGVNQGKIASFNLTIGDTAYEMYNGVVTRGSSDVVGSYDYSTSVLTIDGTTYYVVTDGLDKGLYSMTASDDGDIVIDGVRYALSLCIDSVLTINGTNVDLVSSVGSNAARTVYFAFKQRIGVTVTDTVTTFDYDVPTASAAAKALSQNVKLRLPSDFTTLYGNKESFSGITHALRYYKAAINSPYDNLSELLRAMSVEEALGLGHVILVTDSNGDPTAPSGAGEYLYTASIDSNSTFYSDYYYYAEGIFTIEKLSAGVIFGESAFLYKDGDEYYKKTLEYASGGMSTMNGFIVGVGVDGVYSSAVTSIGVSGRYAIATDTPDYANPSATTGRGISVEIVFTPSEVNSYDGGKYAVLNASNVAEQRLNVSLEVSRRNVEIVVSEEALSRIYSGIAVNPSVSVKLHDGLALTPIEDVIGGDNSISVPDSDLILDVTGLEISYRYRRSTLDSFSSTVLPVNVGSYDAEIIVEGDNFYGRYVLSENEQQLVIDKKPISVSASFSDSYEYTYYQLPSGDGLYAYDLSADDNGVMREDKKNVSFSVSYEYGTEQGSYSPISGDVFNAGYYRVTVSISDDNYSGSTQAEFKINRVTKTSSGLSISQPTIGLRDQVYARYGETLSDLLVTGGNGVNVKFFRSDGSIMTVGGDKSFSWAGEGADDYYALYSPDASKKFYQNTVLDAVTSNMSVDIWFIPDDLVNFEPFTVSLSLSVDKALPEYSGDEEENSYDAHLSPITYGTALSDVELISAGGKTAFGSKKKFSGNLFYYYGGEKTAVSGTFSHNYDLGTLLTTGTHSITLSFTPSDSEHFETIADVTLDLVVNKRPLTLKYTETVKKEDHTETVEKEKVEISYGDAFSITDRVSNEEGIGGLNYIFKISVDSSLTDAIDYYDTLPVGDYYIGISVDSELYSGQLIMPFTVNMATPYIDRSPTVSEFEWDDKLSELNSYLNNGTAVVKNKSNGNLVSGTFEVIYGSCTADTTFESEYKSGRKYFCITIRFTPTGMDAFNYSSKEFDYDLWVNAVTLSGAALGFENTSAVYDGKSHTPTLYVTHPTIDGGAKTDFSDYVSYSAEPIDQGTYSLIATINRSELYRGSAVVGFTVEALSADGITIDYADEYRQTYNGVERIVAPYTGEEISLDGVFSLTADGITAGAITYNMSVKNYAGYTLTSSPVEMGRYYVEISFYGNFSGKTSFYFFISEGSVDYSETDSDTVVKTYSPDSLLTGRISAPTITPSTAFGTVKYAPATLDAHGRYVADGDFSETVPYRAGTYIARTFFDAISNNGYEGYDDGLVVVIEKAIAVVETQKISDPVYTGENIDGADMLNKAFSVKISSKFDYTLDYEYSEDGEHFSSDSFSDAGSYYIKLTIVADDYKGSAVYAYEIKRADLTYLGASDYNYRLTIEDPIIYSRFVLGDDDNDYFNRTDSFRFNDSVVSGSILISGRESIKSLYSGSYERDYVFIPDNVNLNSYSGRVSFVIAKRDISDYLVFDAASIDTVYDSTQKSAVIRFLTEEEELAAGLAPSGLSSSAKKSVLSSVTVSYNGSLTLPHKASSTDISATIGDLNYTATVESVMTIRKGTPAIYAPLTGATSEEILNASVARIEGAGTIAEGSFACADVSDGLIKLTFTPTDSDNLESAIAYAMVSRIVTASPVDEYGKTLSDSVISVDGNPTDEIVWKNATEKLRFGDNEYEAVYTYGGVSRIVKIRVELTDSSVDNYLESFGGIYYVVSIGAEYGQGRVSVGNGSADAFTLVSVSDKTLSDTVAGEHFLSGDLTATLGYRFGGADLTTTVPVRLHLGADNFRFTLREAYAGEKITLSDLYGGVDSYITLSVVGAGVVPEYIITVTDSDGNDLTDVGIDNVGTYTIRFVIDKSKSRYDGECAVSFTLKPTDLSAYIVVNDGAPLKKTFSEVYSILATLEDCPVTEEVSFLYYYKKASAPDSAYSMYDVPSEAGEYNLKVVIADSDYYGGEVVLDYVIDKRLVTVMLNGQQLSAYGDVVYRCAYGSVVIPALALSDGVGSYRLTYYKDGETYLDVPENAGDYLVTVTIDETNYTSDASFTLSISRLDPTFSVLPTVEDIYYGTGLAHAVISSYVADTDGTVKISDADLNRGNLHVGDNEITLVFTPVNSNYRTVELTVTIKVLRATADFVFDVTEIVYTGEEIVPSYTTDSFVSDSDVVFTVYNAGGELAVLKDAGTYYVRVEVGKDADYDYYYTNVPSTSIGDFSKYQKLIIKKASATGYVDGSEPTASTVEYGDPLSDASIIGSVMSYDDGKGGQVSVRGSFAYVAGDVMLYTVGNGQLFDVIFTPDDGNYEPYRFKIPVNVKKKSVSISVTDGNRITYGEKISSVLDFTFRIDGHSDLTATDTSLTGYKYLSLDNSDSYVGTVLSSGSYQLKIVLDHDLYEGELDFILTVDKRRVVLSFYRDSALTEEMYGDSGYTFTFGQNGDVYAGLSSDFIATELGSLCAATGLSQDRLIEDISKKVRYTFVSTDGLTAYDGFYELKKNAGQYKVKAELYSSSDFIATAEAYVTVKKNEVGRVDIDFDSLNEQFYGSVTEPVVSVYDKLDDEKRLTGISYYIIWGDSLAMPTTAGKHNGKLVVNDANYDSYEKTFVMTINPKVLSVTELKVYDKNLDGTPWLKVSAKLSGMLPGDEVELDIEAYTYDKSTSPGKHDVIISKCRLYGLDSGNYVVTIPSYDSSVTIFSNEVYSSDGSSYVVYPVENGEDVSFNVAEIDSDYNKTGLISFITGQSATVLSYSVRKDGVKVSLDTPVRVYIKIPDRYRNRSDLVVEGAGALKDSGVVFSIEGDYVTFTTSVSGEIVFTTSGFPYGVILIAAGLLVLVIGLLTIAFLDPSRSKSGFSGIRRVTKTDDAYRKYNLQKKAKDNRPPTNKKR